MVRSVGGWVVKFTRGWKRMRRVVREGQTLLYKLHCICLILRNSIMNRLVRVTVCSFSLLVAAAVAVAARNRLRSSFKRAPFCGAENCY